MQDALWQAVTLIDTLVERRRDTLPDYVAGLDRHFGVMLEEVADAAIPRHRLFRMPSASAPTTPLVGLELRVERADPLGVRKHVLARLRGFDEVTGRALRVHYGLPHQLDLPGGTETAEDVAHWVYQRCWGRLSLGLRHPAGTLAEVVVDDLPCGHGDTHPA